MALEGLLHLVQAKILAVLHSPGLMMIILLLRVNRVAIAAMDVFTALSMEVREGI